MVSKSGASSWLLLGSQALQLRGQKTVITGGDHMEVVDVADHVVTADLVQNDRKQLGQIRK